MKLSFKLLGVEIVPPWEGCNTYIYFVSGEHGEVDTIRDEDYLDDGEYEVADDFWDNQSVEEETEEW